MNQKAARQIYVRFDIDTVTCIEQGVPRLLELARRYQVKFTFFVNMGRAIDHKEIFINSPARTLGNITGQRRKISVMRKLGIRDALRTVVFNPNVGLAHLSVLEKIVENGHELGLHGGNNHSIWQRRVHNVNQTTIHAWLDEIYDSFVSNFGPPKGFASPGGNYSTSAYYVLKELGFQYVSDLMADEELSVSIDPSSLIQIPVNAQVHAVPLIEHYRAIGLGDSEVVDKVIDYVESLSVRTVVAHPVWEGFRDVILFERIVAELLNRGHQFGLFHDLAELFDSLNLRQNGGYRYELR